jgi:hypothetical protein
MRLLLRNISLLVVLVLGMVFIGGFKSYTMGGPEELPSRSDELANATAGIETTHLISFQISDTAPDLGSILIEYCSESPLWGDPCTAPNGLDASAVTLANQIGNTNFTISGASTSSSIILTRPPAATLGGQNTYQLNNMVNPSADGTYYVRIAVYPTTDATGLPTQTGGIAIAINSSLTVNTIVPPYLNFCAGIVIVNYNCQTLTNYVIDMGNMSYVNPNVATSEFTAASNSGTGYIVSVTGTTLTSGNNTIPALTTPSSSVPGISSFGINLRANSDPNIGADPSGPGIVTIASNYDNPNKYLYVDGDTLVTTTTSSNYKLFTVSYVTNVSNKQLPGVYATTLTFICLANF